jgi:hypothetical protein
MYAGDFYDDSGMRLLDPRPFSAINDAETLDGLTLFPPKPNQIIPAGTLVDIYALRAPSTLEKFRRPIYSARENIWLLMRVAQERGKVNIFYPKPYVMLLPKKIKNTEETALFLKDFFAKSDPNIWILGELNAVQQAIWLKKPIIGMDKRALRASLGPALEIRIEKSAETNTPKEIWHYHDYYIVIEHEKISKIKLLTK